MTGHWSVVISQWPIQPKQFSATAAKHTPVIFVSKSLEQWHYGKSARNYGYSVSLQPVRYGNFFCKWGNRIGQLKTKMTSKGCFVTRRI